MGARTPTAAPLGKHATPVAKHVSRRIGYRYVNTCRHCYQSIVILNDELPGARYATPRPYWRHRDHGNRRTCPPKPLAQHRDWRSRHPELYP
jgi:hypothetical protein